jgi:hypothetical protein
MADVPRIEKESTFEQDYPLTPGNNWARGSVYLRYAGDALEGKVNYVHGVGDSDWHVTIEPSGSRWHAYAWSGDVDENETIATGDFVEVVNAALEAMATGAVPEHIVDGTIISYDPELTYESALEILDSSANPITEASKSLDPDEWGTGDPRMLLKDRSVIEVWPRKHNNGRILVRSPSREDGKHYAVHSTIGLDSVLDDLGFPVDSN